MQIGVLLTQLQENGWRQNIPYDESRLATHRFGRKELPVDDPLFHAIGTIYSSRYPQLRRVGNSHARSCRKMFKERRQSGVIVAFSGYSTGGNAKKYEYTSELNAIRIIFSLLAGRISLVIHGGTREGVPAIANLFACQYGIPTATFLPPEGLDWLAEPVVTYLTIASNWKKAAQAHGKAPDVLFLLGEGGYALRECQAALSHGRVVVGVAFKSYPENSAVYQIRRDKLDAYCERVEELRDCVIGLI